LRRVTRNLYLLTAYRNARERAIALEKRILTNHKSISIVFHGNFMFHFSSVKRCVFGKPE